MAIRQHVKPRHIPVRVHEFYLNVSEHFCHKIHDQVIHAQGAAPSQYVEVTVELLEYACACRKPHLDLPLRGFQSILAESLCVIGDTGGTIVDEMQ